MNADSYARLAWREPAPPDFRARVTDALSADDGVSLRRLAQFGLTEAQLHQLGRAVGKARSAGAMWPALTPVRLLLLSNGTTEHLHHALIASALRYGIDLTLLTISYEEAVVVAMAGDSRVSDFAPDLVLAAFDHRALPLRDVLGDADQEPGLIADCIDFVRSVQSGLARHVGVPCIVQTVAMPTRVGVGSADGRTAGSVARIITAVNAHITATADVLLDAAALAATVGHANWFDHQRWYSGKIPFALEYVPLYADHVGRVLGALRGRSRRVLVLDLDNTLWGGVVGDDGAEGLVIGNGTADGEAFLDVQRIALALRRRGVLLAVSSKNDEAQARRPFRETPGMLLREDDFSAFHANWSDKAANIEAIAAELSLGLDTFVFLDDNPAERALVRRFLPDVAVPELPADPADYAQFLDAAGYFEAVTLSAEDLRRADLYQSRAALARVASHDLGDYLANLDMQLEVDRVHAGNRARVVQLINKSNQFNLTTRRCSDPEIAALETDTRWDTLVLRLTDRLDDHGIISVILAEQVEDALEIATWVMSCRVIGRGVERAVLSAIVRRAAARQCRRVVGRYLPTSRNGMVAQHYERLGFTPEGALSDGGTQWSLSVPEWNPGDTPIRVIDVHA